MTERTSPTGSVVVTGGANGIGAAVATRLLETGYHVVVLDPAEDGELQPHERLTVVDGDATDVTDIDRACLQAAASDGGLVGLVANAGFNRPGASHALSRADWEDVVGVNLTAVFEAARAAERHRQGRLSFVAISSLASLAGLPGRVAYSAAKAGINGMVRSLAVEWASRGVRVNAVAPGFIMTKLIAKGLREGTLSSEQIVTRTPMGRFGEPGEVARAVSFLLSDDASFITGVVLPVDGGAVVQGLPATP